jgi:site-specific DNA-adenine methylase
MFSYYGSKSKIIDHYPAPKFNKIIEPFAGSARYLASFLCSKMARPQQLLEQMLVSQIIAKSYI